MTEKKKRRLGCCVDRKYGTGCNDDNCMQLPADTTCADCVHVIRCTTLFGSEPENDTCEWFPRRFARRAT